MESMTLENTLNMTPHDIDLRFSMKRSADSDEDYVEIVFPKREGFLLRVDTAPREIIGHLESSDKKARIALAEPPVFTGISMPTLPKGTRFIIVSAPTGEFMKTSPDLVYAKDQSAPTTLVTVFAPDSDGKAAVRNEKGQVIGARQLVRYTDFYLPSK